MADSAALPHRTRSCTESGFTGLSTGFVHRFASFFILPVPVLLLSLCFCGVFALFASPVRAESPKDELKGVKKEIREKKKLISKTKKVEAAVSSELLEINKNLEQKEADLHRLDQELESVEKGLERTGREIERVKAEAEQKKREIDKRLVSLYKAGEIGALRMFFSSGSFPQMAENIRYMGSILENDKKIFQEYNNKVDELTRLKALLERDAARKEKLKDGIASKKKEIEQEKQKKASYLGKVRQDRKSYEASLKELQANASRLQSMIERLESRSRNRMASRHDRQAGGRMKPLPELPPVPDRGFESQRGRMLMPVKGQVIETYGKHKHPEFNSYTFSKGLAISASQGADIRSIYEGSVIFADYFKGYGNMVIVDHGGGYFSLYAHASRIAKKVGAEVAKNEVIASVGDVDSSRGPVLYFEIRHQGRPVDPAGWVR